jgi:hypothetical protein
MINPQWHPALHGGDRVPAIESHAQQKPRNESNGSNNDDRLLWHGLSMFQRHTLRKHELLELPALVIVRKPGSGLL